MKNIKYRLKIKTAGKDDIRYYAQVKKFLFWATLSHRGIEYFLTNDEDELYSTNKEDAMNKIRNHYNLKTIETKYEYINLL